MNVLADRHHSGLFHSLQLLAVRLGWELWTPYGHEWWDEGIWQFGQGYGDDRLAQQFLMDGEPVDNEFPEWGIRRVTLSVAREMDWSYVIASVPDNEQGFARFAREVRARFVMQVGNTGQYVNWGLDPLVLSSSEMPIFGRGLVYHQEMDPVAYVPPTHNIRAVGSFVNCMPSMGRCWDLFSEYDRLSPSGVMVYGIDGADGIIKPYSRLVGLMGNLGWGWHDKAQGDGFGHVIHSWAAVGRPLIGHASHYRGKMAEPFWVDGVTCLDLDRRSIRDVVDTVQGISPAEHAQMCRAIRKVFDEVVDYDREAAAIAAFLGTEVSVAA